MAKSSPRRSDAIYGWLMGAPAFLGVFTFIILPFIIAIALSLTNARLISPTAPEFVGLGNYDRLLSVTILRLNPLRDEASGRLLRDSEGKLEFPRSRSILRSEERYEGFFEWFTVDIGDKRYVIAAKDPVFMRSLRNNLFFASVVVPLQSSLALALALLVNQRIRGARLFRTIYFSPVVTSITVMSVVWIFLYNKDAGLINQFVNCISAGQLGSVNWLGDVRSAMWAIIILSIWHAAGFQMVIFLAGLQSIPEILYEAASIDGANARQRFWYVTLPGLRNTSVFVVIITTIFSFRLFTQVRIMTQGGPRDNATSSVVFHAVEEGFRAGHVGYGSAISVVFFLIVLCISLIQRFALRNSGGE